MEHTTTSLIFTGDIGFDKYMNRAWNDEQLLSDEIMDFLSSADIRIANMEGAVAGAEDVSGGGTFFHVMDPAVVSFTRRIHTDFWNINNNHIMDGGRAGLESTLRIAAQEGVGTYGAGLDQEQASAPLYIDRCCGNRCCGIGLISVGYRPDCVPATENAPGCFMYDDEERIAKRLREIKDRCRWAIVTVHGGDEFLNLPLPEVRKRYLHYLELGADIVVGSHPHVVQNYETVGGKIVFYSLGNFIFDTDYQRAQRNTDTGVLLKLNLCDDGTFTWDAVGVHLDREKRRFSECPPPAIFTDISPDSFEKLTPLNAFIRLTAERRRQLCVRPAQFEGFTDAQWENFFVTHIPNDKWYYGDLRHIKELADAYRDGAWKDGPPAVVEYMSAQL